VHLIAVLGIGLGSAVGGVTRYAVGTAVQRGRTSPFPAGTWVINISGSFLLGVLLRVAVGSAAGGDALHLALTAGFCGGYTTFSTFSFETITLIESGLAGVALRYAAASVGVGVLATAAGIALGNPLHYPAAISG
jgi:CrcB protein